MLDLAWQMGYCGYCFCTCSLLFLGQWGRSWSHLCVLFTDNTTSGTQSLMSGLRVEWMRWKPENSIHDTSLSSSELCPTRHRLYPIKYACHSVVLYLVVFGCGYMVIWPIFLRFTWLALWKTYGCPRASQVTLKIKLTGTKSQQNTTKCEPCVKCDVVCLSANSMEGPTS